MFYINVFLFSSQSRIGHFMSIHSSLGSDHHLHFATSLSCFAVGQRCPYFHASSSCLRVFLPELESQGETPRLPPSLDVFRKRSNQNSYQSVICTSIFCPRPSDRTCRSGKSCMSKVVVIWTFYQIDQSEQAQ